MYAFVFRISGLRELTGRMSSVLCTRNFSSVSHALCRACSLGFVRELVDALQGSHTPVRDELIALDSMAVSLPATRRHRCAKMNRNTVGGGVLWAFMIQARRGVNPVCVLKTMQGAWNDSYQIRSVKLTPRLPVYLMDRGFFSLLGIEQWLNTGVRFIMRSRKTVGVEVLRELSDARRYRGGRIEMDAVVRLGGARAKTHPEVRMIVAVVGKTRLSLVTGEMRWSAGRILDAYKQRQCIEQFHRVLKETMGLAHLYNFSQNGMEFLLYTVLLLAIVLIMNDPSAPAQKTTLKALRGALRQLRTSVGVGGMWKRNTPPAFRFKSKTRNR